MSSIVSDYRVIVGHIKMSGKWYPKGEVLRGLALPIAKELVKAGRIEELDKEQLIAPPTPELPPQTPKTPPKPPKK